LRYIQKGQTTWSELESLGFANKAARHAPGSNPLSVMLDPIIVKKLAKQDELKQEHSKRGLKCDNINHEQLYQAPSFVEPQITTIAAEQAKGSMNPLLVPIAETKHDLVNGLTPTIQRTKAPWEK
jgi:hypothetical protein